MQEAILLPSHSRIDRVSDNQAVIEIEGLHPGYGITLGNALKRVLHSSLPGAAVTEVKIDGVNHEFSTIDGVLEDVLAILLSLKQVRFKMHTKDPQKVKISITGAQAITAGDIQCPSSVEVVNKDFHIATITDSKTTFTAELTVEAGVGYVTREAHRSDKVEVGVIALDAIFTPVRKVRYEVEDMRVGTSTNYNRLKLSISTDGSLLPEDAFVKAVGILEDQLAQIKTFGNDAADSADATAEEETAQEILQEIQQDKGEQEDTLKIEVEDLKLSSRTINALNKAEIKTIKQLIKYTPEGLRDLDGVGDKAVVEIQESIDKLGVSLSDEA